MPVLISAGRWSTTESGKLAADGKEEQQQSQTEKTKVVQLIGQVSRVASCQYFQTTSIGIMSAGVCKLLSIQPDEIEQSQSF